MLIVSVERVEVGLTEGFDIDQTVRGAGDRCDDLVQLQLNG